MSHRPGSVDRRSDSYSSYGGGGSSGPSGKDLKRIVGFALMAVGALFTLYGAGSGLSTLVRVSLDNFGLVFLAGTINFIFWTVVIFPIGGLIANTLCALGGVLVFGGLPAIPGAAIALGGAVLYYG
ncbi:MAG TPA: hypothetical protein VIJ14_02440 [Rhabdochlamydiaceae bacterium]